ncbi:MULTISPECIES: single-stranded DNA-binding protein [unclassified Streptomyces]|uniref:single-stranded DNA-binding protein n=1 Tax=unclassified Streptomyces TaxID=2593676 RepID=UPI002E170BEA|nr:MULTISPECIES: single-stranded DNA-binding protein [unclassified Streptomyces]
MSSETMVTVVGNVATTPVFRELPTGPVARFRLAAHSRRFDRVQNVWVDGHTNFFTVWAWRGLGTNVQSSLALGEPVMVQGKLKVRDEERGGQHWTSADIEAVAIGHDLSRGTSAFHRTQQVRAESAPRGDSPWGGAPQGDSPWDVAKPDAAKPGEVGAGPEIDDGQAPNGQPADAEPDLAEPQPVG